MFNVIINVVLDSKDLLVNNLINVSRKLFFLSSSIIDQFIKFLLNCFLLLSFIDEVINNNVITYRD